MVLVILNIVDKIKNNEIAMIINTPRGRKSVRDSYYIRRAAIVYTIPYFTKVASAKAVARNSNAHERRAQLKTNPKIPHIKVCDMKEVIYGRYYKNCSCTD